MKRIDFEIRAAEFFLCGSDIKLQYAELQELEDHVIPHGVLSIGVWAPFELYPTSALLGIITRLADNYEEFYNMKNEKFRKSSE